MGLYEDEFSNLISLIQRLSFNISIDKHLLISSDLEKIKQDFQQIISEYETKEKSLYEIIQNSNKDFGNSNFDEVRFGFQKDNTVKSLELNKNILNETLNIFQKPDVYYFNILAGYLKAELKENFQISSLEQVIRSNKNDLVFEIKDILLINIKKNNITISQKSYEALNNSFLNNLVFFESTAYWRLSSSYLNSLNKNINYRLYDTSTDEKLTGIPQHFLDLRELVFANFKHGERPNFIEECADELQSSLNGKFNSNGNDLAFETNQGKAISKNLVSFGMTNLGVLQAVLSKNIINKGSFVFIDEPESNLHPEWQAVLAKILVKLAENGVFVIITTHSSDMLKALDVYTKVLPNVQTK